MSEFLHMGGYAAYVWSSYGLTFLVLLPMLIMPIKAHKKLINKIKGKYRRDEAIAKQRLEQESE